MKDTTKLGNIDCKKLLRYSSDNLHQIKTTIKLISVSDAGGTPITEAEWYHGDEISNPAYIKGQSNRKIKVLFDSQYTGIAHLIITVSYASGSSYGIGTICNLFVANFDLGIATADTLTIQFTETLPNYVGKHTFA